MLQKNRRISEKLLFKSLLILVIELSLLVALFGQDLKQKNHVFDMGGAGTYSGTLKLIYAIGQPSAIGNSNDINFNVSMGFLPQVLGIITAVEVLHDLVPEKFFLHQNYPNPFNPSTTIEFGIAKSCQVKIKIMNILGQIVAQPIDRRFDAGSYQITFDASNLVSGVYLYQIETDEFKKIRKMILTK